MPAQVDNASISDRPMLHFEWSGFLQLPIVVGLRIGDRTVSQPIHIRERT